MIFFRTRSIAAVAVASSLLSLGNLAQADSITSEDGKASAQLTVQSDWGSGYCASVSVSNHSNAAVTSWQVVINTNNSTINNLWNGNLNGNAITGMSYNSTITAGGNTSFGFCANTHGNNYLPTLSGVLVNGGGSVSSSSSISSSTSSPLSSSISSQSSSVTSQISSSLSSSLSSSSAPISSSSSVSSSSAPELIPNAVSNGWPYCRSADSDPDGDGWGWENSYSCIVYGSAADAGPGDFPYCLIGADQITLCETDNGSWNAEAGQMCLSRSMCPGMGSTAQAPMRDAPVNPNADATTQNVYSYLQSIWGEYMLSGQMDLTWQDNIDQYQRVINDTGRAPAIMGYDFMNYGLY